MCFFKYRKKESWFFLSPKSVPLKILKLLRVTSNDMSEFFGLVPGAWWPSDLRKGNRIPKIYHNHQKILQMELRMTSPSLSLSLSGRPVIVNIGIIDAFTVEPKCLYCPDWRRLQILKFIWKELSLTQYLYLLPTYESKNEHLTPPPAYFCTPRTEQQIIQVFLTPIECLHL